MQVESVIVNGETIVISDIRTVSSSDEMINIQRGPLDPAGPDNQAVMVPSGLVETRIVLKSGRVLRTYESLKPVSAFEYESIQKSPSCGK